MAHVRTPARVRACRRPEGKGLTDRHQGFCSKTERLFREQLFLLLWESRKGGEREREDGLKTELMIKQTFSFHPIRHGKPDFAIMKGKQRERPASDHSKGVQQTAIRS